LSVSAVDLNEQIWKCPTNAGLKKVGEEAYHVDEAVCGWMSLARFVEKLC